MSLVVMQTRTATGLGQFIWLAVESFNNFCFVNFISVLLVS